MFALYQKYFQNILSPEGNRGEDSIGITTAIILSWPFAIFKLILEFVLTYAYLDQVTRSLVLEGEFEQLFESFSRGSLQSGFIILFASTFFHMITFPIWEILTYWLWVSVIRFYLWVLKMEKKEIASEVVCASMSSHAFSIVPIFGDFARNVSKVIILFQGLRKRLQLSAIATLLIVLSPFLLWLFLLAGSGLFFLLLFNI